MIDVTRDYYELIGLPRDATQDEIDAKCVHLAQKWRPQDNPDDVVAESYFRIVEEAYETLGNPAKRTTYDFSLSALDGGAAPRERSPYDPPQATGPAAYSPQTGGPVTFKFTGQAGEYFRIWIVNVCLSVITLGIYSAWAKVRRKRYFYGNTLLRDAAFEYLADPKAILKGRLIVVGVLVVFGVLAELLKTKIFSLFYLAVLPYVVIKAARFNAVNSAYRNVRFNFGVGFRPQTGFLSKRWIAGYNQTSQFLILPIFLVPITLGLLYPYYAFRKRQFMLEHSAYGTTPATFDARPGMFYFAYFKIMLFFILFLIGSIVTVGIGLLPFYILFASYRDAAVARLSWKHTSLGTLRFDCNWKTWDLFKLNFVNSLAIIFTLGLMAPWAAIRIARYELQGLSLAPADAIDGFAAAMREQVTATGDEAGDLLGLDFGL